MGGGKREEGEGEGGRGYIFATLIYTCSAHTEYYY